MIQNSEETQAAMEAVDMRYAALRKQHPRADISPFLLELLHEQADETVRGHIRVYLQAEYSLRGNFAAAAEIIMQEIDRRPTHPMPLLSLVSQKFYSEQNAAEALPHAMAAVALADNAREFRRHARASLLRVSAAVGDTDLVRKCLIEIIELDLPDDEPDIALEADLLLHAKNAGVDHETLLRYRDLLGHIEGPVTGELPAWRSRDEEG